MKKIGSEIRFENNYQTALQELQLLNKKPNKDRAESVKTLIKEMDRCITNIQQTLLGNSKINKKDAQNKVQLYKQQKKSVFSSLEAVELQLKQKQLFQYRSNNKEAMNDEQKLKYENRELALKLNEQVKTIHKTLNEAKTVTKDTVVELQGQRKVIENIDNQIEEAEGELSTINEFMSIISNRNLLTRLILFALILFLGAADLIIIILKIK